MKFLKKLWAKIRPKAQAYRPPTMATVETDSEGKSYFQNAYGQFDTYEDYSASLGKQRHR